MPGKSIHTQSKIIIATMVLHNFVRAHQINNNGNSSRYTKGTFGHSERGHYDVVAHAISMLDEPEMKQVHDNITASICADDN